MVKGDKIVDLRDSSIHIIETIDKYESITLVFTVGKKYIPISEVMKLDVYVAALAYKSSDIIVEEIRRIRNEVKREFRKQRRKDSFLNFFKKLFNLKNIFK